jgi:hypothetical protein
MFWLAVFCWQNHYHVMLLFSQGCHIFQSLHFKTFKEDSVQIPIQRSWIPKLPSGRPCKASRRSSVSNIRPDDVAIPSRHPSVSRRFKQFKVAFVRTSWQHVRTLITVRQEIGFPSHTHRYGKIAVSIRTTGQHHPDAILDKARRGEELQPFGRQGYTIRMRSLLWLLRAAEVQPSGR